MLHCPEAVRSHVLNSGLPQLSELAGALNQEILYEIGSARLEG